MTCNCPIQPWNASKLCYFDIYSFSVIPFPQRHRWFPCVGQKYFGNRRKTGFLESSCSECVVGAKCRQLKCRIDCLELTAQTNKNNQSYWPVWLIKANIILYSPFIINAIIIILFYCHWTEVRESDGFPDFYFPTSQIWIRSLCEPNT